MSDLLQEIEKLKHQLYEKNQLITHLKKEVRSLLSKSHQKKTVSAELKKYFSPSQAKQILQRKRVRWEEEDIVKGLLLCSVSKRCYTLIRRKNLFPVPAISTLRKWVSNFSCLPGVLTDVLSVLRQQMDGQSNANYKLGVLLFDEMEIKRKFEYFQKKDCVFAAYKKVQVAMIRGLCSDWKQPVFVNFDKPMVTDILTDILLAVESTGIEIWAMACDMESSNQALLNRLGINLTNTSFPNPADPTRRIFVFPDVPHLLKLLRNHLLDHGLELRGNVIIGKSDFAEILEADSAEFKINPRLTDLHISCIGSQRQRVRPAAQLLSHSSATAMRCLSPGKGVQADFVDLVNNW